MVQYGFHFHGQRCTGCKTCILACKDYHGLSSSVSFRQVYEYGGGSWIKDAAGCWSTDSFVYYVSVACNHCTNPACVKACPTGAMHKNHTGFITVDEERCIGCGYCALTCPYHAPKLDENAGHSVKCNACENLVARGELPSCVAACPQRALEFGDLEDLYARYGKGEDIAPLPSSAWTSPHLIVTPPAKACLTDSEHGTVLNVDEIV